jgi:hypothetical protein
MEIGNKRFKIQALEAQSNEANKKKTKKGKLLRPRSFRWDWVVPGLFRAE